MHRITDKLLRSAHWMLRFRHRKGYGIHSPFAFNFVTGVVYEQGTFYAYRKLDERYAAAPAPLLRRKDYRLLLRLANFQRPRNCLLVNTAADALLHEYLAAGSCHTQYTDICGSLKPEIHSADMIVAGGLWEEQAELLTTCLKRGGLLVVVGLKEQKQRKVWRRLLATPQAQVSFDLRDFGLVFYLPELQREHYTINYL